MSPVPDEDPDKPDREDMENLEAPNLVIPAVIDNSEEDEEEDDEDGGNGYQLLPQGPDDVNGNGHFQEDSENDSGMSDGEEESSSVGMATGIVPSGLYPNFPHGELPSYLQVPDLPRSDKNEILWNQPRTANVEKMDSGQVASIKNAMKGFHLPATNIPDWAKNMSEDKWKEQLLTRISSSAPSDTVSSSCTVGSETSHSSESSLSETEKETG